MFLAGLGRVGDVSDPDYRSALAKLVGAAFYDDARIDEVEHLTSQLVKLEPLHLRVLYQFLMRDDDGLICLRESGDVLINAALNAAEIALSLDVSTDITLSVLSTSRPRDS